jgi:hypothetical protein
MTPGQKEARRQQRHMSLFAWLLVAASFWVGTPRASDTAIVIAFVLLTGSAVIDAMRALANDAAPTHIYKSEG